MKITFTLNKSRRYIITLLVVGLLSFQSQAQVVKVIDRKGTITDVNNNQVTTSLATAKPTNPVIGDVWFETDTLISEIWDGTNWVKINTWLGYKTIHHNHATMPLAITHALHNNADIHIEGVAGLSITNTAVNDGTNFYITNTTGADKALSFAGFTGAFLRNGGAEADRSVYGLTLKPNTRYLCHITENSGFYFNATEAGGSGDIVPLWKSDTNGGDYAINDIINYDGNLYKNLTGDNFDTLPNADAANWEVFAGGVSPTGNPNYLQAEITTTGVTQGSTLAFTVNESRGLSYTGNAISLKQGTTYLLRGAVSGYFNSSTNNELRLQWEDANGVKIGELSRQMPGSVYENYAETPEASAVYTPTADIDVHLEVVVEGSEFTAQGNSFGYLQVIELSRGGGTGIALYDVNTDYSTGDSVIKDEKIYIANGNIPSGTLFATGTAGATWKEIYEDANRQTYDTPTAVFSETISSQLRGFGDYWTLSAQVVDDPTNHLGHDGTYPVVNVAGKYRITFSGNVYHHGTYHWMSLAIRRGGVWQNITKADGGNSQYVPGSAVHANFLIDGVVDLQVGDQLGYRYDSDGNHYLLNANTNNMIVSKLSYGIGNIRIYDLADTYQIGNVVIKDTKLYQANDAIPATTAFVIGTTGATWTEISADVSAVREWVNNTNGGIYAINDLVSYSGVIYRNLLGSNLDTIPSSDTTNWAQTNSYLGNQTVHHNAVTTLAIKHADHNNADIHVENTGDLSIAKVDVNDGTNFYITNTSGMDRLLTFASFTGAFLRNGGAEADVKTGGLTLKSNTRYLAHVTDNSGSFYFNATEAGGSGDIVPLWKSDTNGGLYSTNDIVNYNGVLYKNLTGMNLDTIPSSDTTNWAQTDSYLGNKTIHYNTLSLSANPTKETLSSIVSVTSTNATFVYDGVGATITTNSSYSGSYDIEDALTGNDHATAGQGTETITITFDSDVKFSKMRGNGRPIEYYKDLSMTVYDAGNNSLATAVDTTTTGSEYFDLVVTPQVIRKIILTATDRVSTNPGVNNIELFGATTNDLDITHVLHNNADIHIESIGDLSITNTDVNDGTNFYITNTTGADRTLSFVGFTGAFLRNGGAEADVKTGGLTLKSNTRYLAHVTDNAGSFYFNATEARGSGVIVPLWKSDTNGGLYSTNDIVNYNGVLYKNLTGMNLDTIPSSDTTNWAQTNSYLGNQTVHHNAVTTLAIKHADHNNADIHVENTGDLSIAKVDVNDGTNFYITNTSGMDRLLTFTSFTGAFLRNGGAEADVKTGGLTLKSNTRYLAHITDNAGSFYFNATEARGSGVIVPLWKSDTNGGSYAIDDIINYSGVLYKNLTGINLDTLPNADTTNWKPTVIDENDGISAKDLLVLDGNGLAIGGVITTDGAHTVHTFTTSGTFVPNGNTNIEYLIVGGGGSAGISGGFSPSGGGGGGGVLTNTTTIANANTPIVVGQGGVPVFTGVFSTSSATNGGDSSLGGITATGGGAGGSSHVVNTIGGVAAPIYGAGLNGGSGGGGGRANTNTAGGQPTAGQGNTGGQGANPNSGGGGGASAAGADAAGNTPGAGGEGLSSSISGTSQVYGSGGGGAHRSFLTLVPGGTNAGNGGLPGGLGGNGIDGFGGGAGGTGNAGSSIITGANGGSGVVIIRYLTDNVTTVLATNNGNVGIGTDTPTHLLSVNGNASKVGGGSWATFSDERVKENIRSYGKGLAEILKINPIIFNYNAKSGYTGEFLKKDYVGITAQEIAKILPETVTEFDDSNGPSGFADKRQFDSSEILWTVINAIQEQQAQLKAKEKAIEDLKASNEALKIRMVKIEKALGVKE
ncbi:hypothetical protein FORMB_21820 [Formosa sp. Hel1_33_131]|uniref:tail fiber domain-containing protein n=1 Tax=Formosa sp. Hel1_33_131 TaxID=1336794 RepID=UPI00084E0BE3|nr:tail fiber domain-containing protein [Formosa sp. Hel1_33_131]AOR29205.1 hypothetical protein FORMB_21820 [Formosa sp. Hel1_33_131]